MTSGVTIKVHGLDALIEDFKNLPPAVQDKVLKPGMRKAGQLVLQSAIAKAPVGTRGRFFRWMKVNRSPGTLKRSIRLGNIQGTLQELVIPIYVDQAGKTGAFYAGMVEYGHGVTIEVNTKGGGTAKRGAGSVPPQPFMRPALDENIEPALDIFSEHLSKGVARQIRKLGK